MANFQIPRAQRQVEDPSEVFRGRAQAPTAATEATQQLGRAIAGAGVNIARISQRNERLAQEEQLNRSISAANEIKQGSVEFIADETVNKAGLDTIGNIERLDSFVEERFLESTTDLSDEAKILTRQELQTWKLKTRTDFAIHQQKQRRGVTLSNLDQARDDAVQEAATNPSVETIEDQIKSMALTVFKYRAAGSIDKEEAEDRITEGREKIITSAIASANLENTESAQSILDEMKTVLPADTVKTLEADITKQRKIQKDAIEAQREETAQTFTNEILNLSLDGAATITQAESDPRWQVLTPSERKTALSIIKNSNPFNESDPVTLAKFTAAVNTTPLELTEQELLDAHGKGLSTADFDKLSKQRQAKIKKLKTGENTLQDQYEKQAYRLIEFMRKDTAFIEPAGFLTGQSAKELQKNDLRAAQQVNSLARYIEENPNEDYVETYIKPVLKPVQEGFVARVYDKGLAEAFFPSISVEKDVGVRRQATDLLTEKGVEATRENINKVSAQIREGNTELKILDTTEAQRLFDIASGRTKEEKAENARRNAIKLGFIIP